MYIHDEFWRTRMFCKRRIVKVYSIVSYVKDMTKYLNWI